MARNSNVEFPKELVSKTEFVDYKTSISKAREYLKSNHVIVVNKDGEYYGIVDSKALASAGSLKLSESEKVGKIAIKAPRVSDSTSIEDMAYYFYKNRVKNLPYSYGGKVTGVVQRNTLLKILLSLDTLSGISVMDVVSTPVLAINSAASLGQAQATMRDRKVNRLIVLENGRFAGLLTSHDIYKQYNQGARERRPSMKDVKYSSANVPIASIMESNVKTINTDASLAEAARVIVENHISSLVVLKGNGPVGILTVSDILEGVVGKREFERRKVIISGFDEYTYQYEDSVREELKSLMDQIERMHKMQADYISLSIKKVGNKAYEMQTRVSLGKNGVFRVHSDGADFHGAFSDAMKKIKNKIMKEKENMVSASKKSHRIEEVNYED